MWGQSHDVQTTSVDALKGWELDAELERLMDRILDAGGALIASDEKRLTEMGNNKLAIDEKIASAANQPANFDKVYRTAFSFLENP
jgi:protein involved in polysaccharide export with SLBB domain